LTNLVALANSKKKNYKLTWPRGSEREYYDLVDGRIKKGHTWKSGSMSKDSTESKK